MIEKAVSLMGRVMLPGLAVLLMSSCFEVEQEFTLNPDGSGKVVHEAAFQQMSFGNEDQDPEQALKSAVLKLIEDSEGVDAWNEVSFKTLDDGRMWFRGTAYFPDINKLKIQNQGMLSLGWERDAKGGAVLGLKMGSNDDAQKQEKPEVADRDAWLKEQRMKFQQSKPMMSAMLTGMSHEVAVRLPGKVGQATNFKADGEGRVTIGLQGTKMLNALESLVADDKWLLENGINAKSSPELNARMSEMLFGENAPVEVKVSAMKPQFNYQSEVAKAVASLPELEKRLGAVGLAPPATGEPLNSIQVVGVRQVEKLDAKLELRPFNYNEGYTLAVLAELPGSVLTITKESEVKTAVASDGGSLLKDKDWDRRLGSPKLSEDKAWVLFDINLLTPEGGLSGIKEITGLIQYRVATGSKTVDLGFETLKQGSTGKELAATIKKIKDGHRDGQQQIEIKLNLKPDDIKEVRLVSGDPAKREVLKRWGYSGSGTGYTFTYRYEGKVPEIGTIEMELHEGLQTFDIPFTIDDFSL